MAVEARLRVIYGDTDQMGVVYYANYFRYMEFSRAEYLRALGWSYREMEAEGALLPVVDAQCSYKASARYDDLLVIKATVTELRRVSLSFSYDIRRDADGVLLATGKTTHACVGRDGKATRIPEKVAQLLRSAEGAALSGREKDHG
ncbi:MAG: acyl-CoA thioesterase [Myxococcaceae bacterium]